MFENVEDQYFTLLLTFKRLHLKELSHCAYHVVEKGADCKFSYRQSCCTYASFLPENIKIPWREKF